jgi:glyoxylase-like metal-dependent hydrolase (beta-lactamase superfamily II)
MQEIAPHIYIDTGYAGVTLGAINWPHGLILIDAPFRAEDTRSWRSALLNLGGGVDRLLVNLDTHFDRTLGTRAMDCTVVGHEKIVMAFRNRPLTFKTQNNDTGADWESFSGLGSIRWSPPEITFSHTLNLYWNQDPLILEYHPGPATGSIWAYLPGERVIFIGDAVIPDQPPFLSSADLPAWLETLDLLLKPEYQDCLFISGRGGMVVKEQILQQVTILKKISELLEELSNHKAAPEETENLIPEILKEYRIPAQQQPIFEQRLRWGLSRYFTRHYRPTSTQVIDD